MIKPGLCVGCASVQADNAPDCGVAQGVIHGVTVRHGEKQEEEEGEVEQEVEGNKEEDNNQTPVRMSMDGMEVTRHCEALSQSERYERVRQHIYKRRAVCSVLHGHLVCVRCVVHTIVHIALRVVENVLEVVHNVP